MGSELGDEVFEGATVSEKSGVRQRPRRQETSQHVQRLGAGRRLPCAVALFLLDWKSLANRLRERVDERAVGFEEDLGGRLVVRVRELWSAVVQKPTVAARPVEPNVPRRLLEWPDPDPAVFQRLGGQGGCAFDSDVGARELGDRVISVTDENPLVELFGAPH